jgi:hypothetical protein
VPHGFDQRAFDAVLTLRTGRVALEFFVRLADAQAQLRAVNLKKRDAGIDRLVVVLADTPINRQAFAEAGPALGDLFTESPRRVFARPTAGELPAADAIVLI